MISKKISITFHQPPALTALHVAAAPRGREFKTVDYLYSYAAILIDVPSAAQRIFGAASGTDLIGVKRKLEEVVEPLTSLASKAALEPIQHAASGLNATFALGGTVKCTQPVCILFPSASLEAEVREST